MTQSCGKCGSERRIPTTIVIDWTAEIICDECVARLDWSDWTFDPITNTYSHN